MNKPVFSILTPVYNVEKFLSACIESVLAQTFTDWELILVDDGSIDNSGKICDEYGTKYSEKIKVFHNKNYGQLYSRNFAVSKANGKYYVFLDADDRLVPNALEIIYNKFQQYQCDMVIYGIAWVTSNGKIISATKEQETFFTDKRELYKKIFSSNKYNSLCIKAIKDNCLSYKDYGDFYSIRHAEDLLQSLEILHNCNKAVVIPDILYHYTQNLSSVTRTVKQQKLQLSFEVREKVLEFLNKENIFNKQDRQAYHNYCVKIFERQIFQVITHPASYKEKIQLFKLVKQKKYYKNFLASKKYKQPIWPIYTQFRLGLYHLLMLEIRLYSYLKGKFLCYIK